MSNSRATDQEKKKIEENDKKQLEIIENKKREKYNPNKIFNNNNLNDKVEDNKSLIIDENIGFFKSILNKIKNIVRKIKQDKDMKKFFRVCYPLIY